MILGIGSDIVNIRRIEAVLARFGERFIKRCFSAAEIDRAEQRRKSGNHGWTYAKRFAAKEACAKALGTGFSQGVFMRDISVVNEPGGQPRIELTGGAKSWLNAITPPGKSAHLHISLSDEHPLAKAIVIIEAV